MCEKCKTDVTDLVIRAGIFGAGQYLTRSKLAKDVSAPVIDKVEETAGIPSVGRAKKKDILMKSGVYAALSFVHDMYIHDMIGEVDLSKIALYPKCSCEIMRDLFILAGMEIYNYAYLKHMSLGVFLQDVISIMGASYIDDKFIKKSIQGSEVEKI